MSAHATLDGYNFIPWKQAAVHILPTKLFKQELYPAALDPQPAHICALDATPSAGTVPPVLWKS